MPSYEDTLLDQTCRAAVARQIAYGRQRGVPWGISESGYNAVDAHLNYQYRAFGVPGLGLKRGLPRTWSSRPMPSALALMVAPEEACANLQRLAGDGLRGPIRHSTRPIDYTPVARAARPDQRGRALVHGAPPGHEPALAGAPAARPADAAALRVRSRSSRRRCCCCRSGSASRGVPARTRRARRPTQRTPTQPRCRSA